MSQDMKREFASRDELIAYVSEQFPQAAARDSNVPSTTGGRKAAETLLQKIDPGKYASSRNFLKGAVTRLSPYLRYGVLSLAEVRDAVLAKVQDPQDAVKLINELGWRDYWQRLYAELGKRIWEDREPYKTGYTAKDYSETLPQDVVEGTTGLVCIDSFSRELRETGYLHNQQRM